MKDEPDAVAVVDESWAVIIDFLRRHAPQELAQIRPPATAEDLHAVEQAVGGPLPADLARWWQLADGVGNRLRLMPAFQIRTPPDVGGLRRAYANLIDELRAGGFAPPGESRWPAETIAAHVRRNTESLLAVNEQIAAADPEWHQRMITAIQAQSAARRKQQPYSTDLVSPVICYDNTDSMDPKVLSRDAARGLDQLTADIGDLYPRLADSVGRLSGRYPFAYANIVDRGTLITDEIVHWWGVLTAIYLRQLPLCTRQLRELRPEG